MRDYSLYLKDILDAMESIERFVQGIDREAFESDDKTSSAVVRKFEIIGEATKHIPDDIRAENPQVPWSEMAGMRDRLIHAYHGIDYDLIWTAIKERIPPVKRLIKSIIQSGQ